MYGDTASAWALGVIMGFLALLGLVMASGAVDPIFYATGLALTVFAILFIFALIRQSTGAKQRFGQPILPASRPLKPREGDHVQGSTGGGRR